MANRRESARVRIRRDRDASAAHIEDLESSLERQAALIESQREALADLKEQLNRDR